MPALQLVADAEVPSLAKEWFAGVELAGLPGLPSSDRKVRARAMREGWRCRPRLARGGGREYHIDSLPAAARTALHMRLHESVRAARVANLEQVDHATLWKRFDTKSDKVKGEAERRLNAVLAVEKLVRDGCDRLEAYAIVAHQVEISESMLRNWCSLVRGHPETVWAPLLAPKWAGRTKTAEYDDTIYRMFRDAYLDLSRPPASTCYTRVKRWAQSEGLAMPSYATLVRELKRREDPSVILLEREGSRALAASYPYQERSREALYAMQMLNADGHNLDLAVVWPDGEPCRATVLTIQDIKSSAIIGYKLMKSESALGMSLAFLDAFDKYGIPKRIFVDNTFAAASKRMTAGAAGRKRFKDNPDDPKGVLTLLGIEVTFVTPAHGQAKPVERSFNTLANQISKHPAFSGAYLGNNPQNKPANYGQKTITIAELEPVVANEIAAYNHQLGRRTEVCQGKSSYQQAFDESYEAHRHEIARLTVDQRRILYLVAERVTVDRRDGCVKLFKNRYWSPELAGLKSRQVIVRYHPTESLHKSVWVYGLNGALIAEAPIYHKAGFADAEAAQKHTRARRQFVRKTKDLAVATRRLAASEVVAMVPAFETPIYPAATAGGMRKVQFNVPASMEQLGIASVSDRRAAEKKVNDALAKMPSIARKERNTA
jgi:putative transposase